MMTFTKKTFFNAAGVQFIVESCAPPPLAGTCLNQASISHSGGNQHTE